MAINIFEGARRVAYLVAGVSAAGTILILWNYDPYVSAQYSISNPNGNFVRMEGSCPSDAGHHYFTTRTSDGEAVSITLCIHAMTFGENKTRLIPYKVDDAGMIWGAASYSTEVSEYERELERRFEISDSDEKQLKKDISRQYWENWKSGIGYLGIGLAIFAGVVWAIGWIVRGFMGIPQGLDSKPIEKKAT